MSVLPLSQCLFLENFVIYKKINQTDMKASTSDENSMNKFVESINKSQLSNFGFSTVDLTGNLENCKFPETPQPEKRRNANLSLTNLSLSSNRKRPGSEIPSLQPTKNPVPSTSGSSNNGNKSFTFLPPIVPNKVASVPPSNVRAQPQNRSALSMSVKQNSIQGVNRDRAGNEVNPAAKKNVNRELKLITGTVSYAMKVRKICPETYALYEIYGNILKISPGNRQNEQLLLLRNDTGPILQAVYCETDNLLPRVNIGMACCCIGRFIGITRFHIFKIKPTLDRIKEASLCRFENLTNFVMTKK